MFYLEIDVVFLVKFAYWFLVAFGAFIIIKTEGPKLLPSVLPLIFVQQRIEKLLDLQTKIADYEMGISEGLDNADEITEWLLSAVQEYNETKYWFQKTIKLT